MMKCLTFCSNSLFHFLSGATLDLFVKASPDGTTGAQLSSSLRTFEKVCSEVKTLIQGGLAPLGTYILLTSKWEDLVLPLGSGPAEHIISIQQKIFCEMAD